MLYSFGNRIKTAYSSIKGKFSKQRPKGRRIIKENKKNMMDKQMFDVDIDCGECNTKITQLPFQPSGDRPVFCTNCLRSKRDNNNNNTREKRMFDVDVNCAECNKHITQLPFQPTGDRPIYCFECNKSRRG